MNNGRTTMVALPDFTPLQGGVPIVVDGEVVGGIGVSGAASAPQDEEIALAGVAALGALPLTEATEIFYLESDKVRAAFEKGMPLLEVTDYKVHASHRDKAGEAEVHENETDIIYVLEGTTTFVTGGKVVGGRSTGAGEYPRRLNRGRNLAKAREG